MNAVKNIRIVLIAAAVICIAAISVPNAYADSYNGCDYCGTYTPAYDSTFTPGYDSTYSPSYDSTYAPSYDSSYWPSYDSTYSPSYDSTYTPSYDSTYTPSYDSTYYPSYDSTYYPTYDTSYTPTYQNPPVFTPPPFNPPHYTPPTYTFTAPSNPQPFVINFPAQQQQQQQQQQQGGGSGPITIVNNNTNTNTNVNNPAPVTVATVTPVPVSYPVQYIYQQVQQAPFCTITISYNGYNSGYQNGPATLTWSSNYATTAYINPSMGTVGLSGSTTVYPTSGTVYTMGVSGPGGSNSCHTNYVYTPTYTQPSVSLSQIPYTGFDFGPVGNAIYWLSLLSFAFAGAYLLVYYKGGAFTLATAFIAKRNPGVAAAIEAPVKAVESAIAPIAKKIDDVLSNLPIAAKKTTTSDSMIITRSENGEAPRIVIKRS